MTAGRELSIGVVGSGATGGYLAGRLAEAGVPVTLLARGASLEAIRRDGIRIDGPGEQVIRARPAQVVGPGEAVAPAHLTLFCVKSYDTAAAPLAGERGRVLCLQNGVGNNEVLAGVFGAERVMAGVLYIGAERTAPGVIRASTPPRLVFGSTDDSNGRLADDVKVILPPPDAPLHPAQVGLIHLHPPRQLVAARANHGAPQLVEPGPRGLVAPQAQDPLQPQGTGPGLLAGNPPDGAEPQGQGVARVLEDGPGRDGCLVPARRAHPQVATSLPPPSAFAPATDHPIRPPELGHVGPAGCLRSKPPLDFGECPRIILHTPAHYILGSLESSGYLY